MGKIVKTHTLTFGGEQSMADQRKAQDVNEAARRFAETLADSYRIVYGQAAESGERQQQRAREFSNLVRSTLSEQAEAGRANAEQLSEQAARQQEAGQQFARESVEAYAQFLDNTFTRYIAGTEAATESARKGALNLSETTAGLVGTATSALGSTAESAAESAVFPIPGYDDMNVDEISSRLNDLSVEEIRLLRDYEERHKKRASLLEQMDRKIRAD